MMQAEKPTGKIELVPAPLPLNPPKQSPYKNPTEALWCETLAMLRQYYPQIGLEFLRRLLAVLAPYEKLSDTELANVIPAAFKKGQKSEGLFFKTVPEALAARRNQPVSPKQTENPFSAFEQSIERTKSQVSKLSDSISKKILPRLEKLFAIASAPDGNMEHVEREAEAIERALTALLTHELSEKQREQITRKVERDCEPYSRMSAGQLAKIRAQFEHRATLDAFHLSRLSLI